MERVVLDREILGGKPVIKGTRIAVEHIMEHLSAGMEIKEILENYPRLTREDVLAAIQYATASVKNEEVLHA
jgi:uncharacterized protein (DUF433 family)